MSNRTFEEPIPGVGWRTAHNAKSAEFRELAKGEDFNALDVADCSHPRRLAKAVERQNYTFVVAKTVRYDAKSGHLAFGNIDFFIKPKSLVTVEEGAEALFRRVAKRFSDDTGKPGVFHIVYGVLDEIVDEYLAALDVMGEMVNSLESSVIKSHSPHVLQRIFYTRKSLIDFRRNAAFMREVVNALLRHNEVEGKHDLQNCFRDLYDHVVQVIEFAEAYRESLTGALDMYVSVAANHTNEVVKMLTVYGTIALPLVVITSFYGMNIVLPFQHSPHAILFVSAVMFACTVAILAYFRKKEWF